MLIVVNFMGSSGLICSIICSTMPTMVLEYWPRSVPRITQSNVGKSSVDGACWRFLGDIFIGFLIFLWGIEWDIATANCGQWVCVSLWGIPHKFMAIWMRMKHNKPLNFGVPMIFQTTNTSKIAHNTPGPEGGTLNQEVEYGKTTDYMCSSPCAYDLLYL